ncbi:MAG: L-fucose:H+ symporter permease [Bacteroidota bacterium]
MEKKALIPRQYLLAFILITSMFLAWGIANNMTDTLLAAFKKIMSMSDFQTTFVQYAFYGAYFCFAIPAALLIKRFSYKTGVLLGLGMFIGGALLFYPASQTMVYGHFLAALYILAGGLSFLETSANPYIVAMGPEESGTQRLNLAQSFNPVGSITGVLLSKFFILSHLNPATEEERSAMPADQLATIQAEELSAVMGPYVGVAAVLLVLWLMIAFTKMPKASDDSEAFNFKRSLGRLTRNRNYVMAVVAQFFYVGAQICIWSFTIRYVMRELAVDEEAASSYYIASLVLFLASRFICTYLMRYIKPARLLSILAALAIVLTLGAIWGSGTLGVYSLVGISACMSLMFPTIYGLGLKGLGKDTQLGGSGLVMAILGGAVLTGIQGLISDSSGSIKYSFYVPLVCFLIVSLYGRFAERQSQEVER